MKDLTLAEFCRAYDACIDGYAYGRGLTPKGGDAMMSEVWPLMDNWEYMRWVLSREGVLTKRERVALSVRFIRETHLQDGRTVYDLLTDKRSIDAIAVCEAYIKGDASDADLMPVPTPPVPPPVPPPMPPPPPLRTSRWL